MTRNFFSLYISIVFEVKGKLKDWNAKSNDVLGRMLTKEEYHNTDRYFYLDFYSEGKGKLGKDRSKNIEDRHVVFGILLLNFYKERYFEKKDIKWEELEHIFEESEQKDYWAMLFYGKKEATPNEIERRKEDVRKTLNFFHELGWINWNDRTDISFEILPSIDRIAKLYASEIENIDNIKEYLHV